MKSSVETLSPNRVRLAVELPFDELNASFDAAYKKIGAQIRVPGFRPGKVPGRVLEQRIGRPVILEEVVNHAVPLAYDEAIRDNEVRVLGRPEIEVTKIDDGDLVAFTAEVDVRPELELPDKSGLAVTVDDLTVSDEDVDEQIETLRERFASLVTADRPAETGDTVTLDLAATVAGAPVEDGTAAGLTHEVGSGQLIDGLDEAITGLAAGESATFQTQLSAGEYGGQTADVAVSVRTVKVKQLDELDDEFAQTVSEFDSLDELRVDARERLRQVKLVQQGTQARDELLESLVAAVDVPLPESVVTGEVDWRRHAMEHQLSESGGTMEEYLAEEGKSEEEFFAELRTNAEKAVATQLILDGYADLEEIGVNEQDLTQHIILQARRYRMPPEQYAQQLTDGGQLPSVMTDVRRNKVLALLLEAATVTDRSGQPVDLSLLRRTSGESGRPTEAVPDDDAGPAVDPDVDEATAIPTDNGR
ncbi:trigger factor [soil metagenome]